MIVFQTRINSFGTFRIKSKQCASENLTNGHAQGSRMTPSHRAQARDVSLQLTCLAMAWAQAQMLRQMEKEEGDRKLREQEEAKLKAEEERLRAEEEARKFMDHEKELAEKKHKRCKRFLSIL